MADKQKTHQELTAENAALKERIQKLEEAEASLREYFGSLLDDVPVLICRYLPDYRIEYVNKQYCAYFNKRAEELIGTSFLSLIPEEDHEVVLSSLPLLNAESPIHTEEHRVILPDGTIAWQRWINHALFDERGRIAAYQSVGEDITELRRAEEEIRKFKTVSDQAVHGIAISDMQGNLLYINNYFADIHGYKPGELIGRNLSLFHNEEQLKKVHRIHKTLIADGQYISEEVWHTHRNGNVFPMLMNGVVVKDEHGTARFLAATAIDIAEIKLAESARAYQADLIEALLNSIPDLIFYKDFKGQYIGCNRAFAEHLGRLPEDIVGKTDYDIYTKEEADAFRTNDRLMLERGSKRHNEEWISYPDGTRVLLDTMKIPFRSSAGDSVGIIGVARNITDRKRAEEALRESERFLQNVFDAIQGGISVLDSDFKVLRVNRRMEEAYAQSCSLIGRKCHEVYQQQEAVCTFCPVARTYETGDVHAEIVPYPSSKSPVSWMELTSYPLRDKQGNLTGAIEYIQDITDRKRLEEELLRNEKLESLGILAGGIAHDFNNLMTSVQGYIELALLDLPSDSVSREELEAALLSMGQTRELTGRLITFSRGGHPWKKTLSLADVIKDVVHRTVKGSGVRVSFDISDDLWPVEADEHQLRQSFVGLAQNAVEAMPDGGVLAITAENRVIAAGEVPDLQEGNYLRITFSDEGVGIPSEIQAKIFDPYFTTKGMGAQKGTGLGLAVCYSVSRSHGGAITVTSRPGEGTSFVIYLPAVVKTEKASVETGPTGHGRILIMDDEPRILEIQRSFLERLGYEVADVADGRDAIDAYKDALEAGEPFDLVILDLTVRGGMGGQAAMEGLLQINPDVRAVIASGYVDDPVLENYTDYGFLGVLKKPFKRDELKLLVEEILE